MDNETVSDRLRTPAAAPTPVVDRLPLLDAIRGVALGGILLANLMSFMGADMMGQPARRAMAGGSAGEAVLFAVNWLVEGKFYSIFSILLGVGFALQAKRATDRGMSPDRFARFFRRRMGVLIVIGLTHMYALWAGDILTLYGVMGLLLPWLMTWPARRRSALMAGLFAVPLATHALVLASGGTLDPRPPFAAFGVDLREQLGAAGRSTLELFARGEATDYWIWNVSTAVVRPGTYLQAGRPAKVLALFLLGAWIGTFVLPRLQSMRRALVTLAIVGGTAGLLGSYVYASIKAATGSSFLLSDTGLIQTAAYTFGTTPLALAYMAAAALAWTTAPGRAMLEWFVPLGRMALSVYLSQTLIQLALFSSLGFGLAGQVPLALLPPVAAAILVTQREFCAWWLADHRHGPAEWLWRRSTYGAAVRQADATARASAGTARSK
jgi:uncharacterized protein